MQYFRIATINTPEVSFDLSKGFISMSGVSTTINSLDFYKKFIDELVAFQNQKQPISFDLNLAYFNTSSAKCIYDMLKELQKRQQGGDSVSINWFYDHHDQDMLEMGQDFSSLTEMDFKFHPFGASDFSF